MTLAAYRLPVPPSANKLWRVHGGRAIKSREYRAWEEQAGRDILIQGLKSVASPFVVRILIVGGKHWNTRRDLDNAIKPLVDAIRRAGVVVSDSTKHMVGVEARFERGQSLASWCCVEIEAVLKGEG